MSRGERHVAAAALLVLAALVLADLLTADHSVLLPIGLLVAGAGLAIVLARTRARLTTLRTTEGTAHRRIELLDRSSRLIATPMDFHVRLRELAHLVVPDVAGEGVVGAGARLAVVGHHGEKCKEGAMEAIGCLSLIRLFSTSCACFPGT